MSVPVNWYQCNGLCDDPPRNKNFSSGFGSRYQFPLPKVKGAPVPSVANYDPHNVAPISEMFGHAILIYENNTPDDPSDDIIVSHPGDGTYLPAASACRPKTKLMLQYEKAAKKSPRLKLYQDNSPANIAYFQQICPDSNDI